MRSHILVDVRYSDVNRNSSFRQKERKQIENSFSSVKAQIQELLRLMRLWKRRKDRVRTYSGGMKRRLAMARALLHDPEIMWRFYEKIGLPGPPLATAEAYPRPKMVHWFPLIAVGLTVLGVGLGGMFNIFLLT